MEGANRFPDEFLPIQDKLDLLRKVYLAIIISHREASKRAWAKANDGSTTLLASHPIPTEVS